MGSNENGLEKLIRGRRSAKRSNRTPAGAALALEDFGDFDDLADADEFEDTPARHEGVSFRDSKDPMDLFLRGRL